MRNWAGYLLFVAGVGLGGFMPSAAKAVPSYALAEKCAQASGFTERAVRHPDYKSGKVHATAKELAFMNRCIDAVIAKSQKPSPTRAARGTLPLPSQFPLMSGDTALWPVMTMAQQRRAMLFLQTGSTIQSSLQGD